jgi:SAM-dependent methyltransferase
MKTSPAQALARFLARLVLASRRADYRRIAKFARRLRGVRILELGSGKAERYSARRLFHPSNAFLQSDVNPEYGHAIIDATSMEFHEQFDVILCLNVLEHVFDFREAVRRIHQGLRPGGVAIIVVPVFYPLHDEPNDFWRFTEHALRRLLADFRSLDIHRRGLRQYPFFYYLEAHK